MLVNRREVEIEFGDCDPAGIVYFPNYFRMFDAATAHLFEAGLRIKKIAWIERYGIVGIPMVDTSAKFIRPSRFGDVVTIETTIDAFRRTSFIVRHILFNGVHKAVEAQEIRVWAEIDPDSPGTIRSKPIPPEIVAALSG